MRRRNEKGFTIVELVIVIAVIAILATTLVPTFGDVIAWAQESAAKQAAKNAYTRYMVEHAAESGSYQFYLYQHNGRFVTIESGAATGVYDTQEEALRQLFDDPETVMDESLTASVSSVSNSDLFLCIPSAKRPLEGKTLSILGASISTYEGTSNGAAANTTNSTIKNNVKYYPHSIVTDVGLNDTWWMQVCTDLGLRLLVNNSWSGSALLHERNGTAPAYIDRCVQLHDDTGENAGEEPDIIAIQMGSNDFQYYKETLGTGDIDYDALIVSNMDGSYTYATPTTSLEAAAIVLHKISIRYPKAEVYYLNVSQRIDGTDAKEFNVGLSRW